MKNTFSKQERLCGKKYIDELYEKGKVFQISHLRITILKHNYNTIAPVMILAAVPKSLFKNAHERNLLKRRIKEAYRLNKGLLLNHTENFGSKYFLSFRYSSKNIEPYSVIEKSIQKVLIKINQQTDG